VGVIVPRHKQTAVARNRLKRRLRELVRLRLLPALADAPPADVVVRVFPPAYAATFQQLTGEVERALRQLARGGTAGR
jgi:ribonuclease P protein component